MAYQAVVVPIMIASPCDVSEERDIVRDVIHAWNYINSEKSKIVLIPYGWETHSWPELGARPQEQINNHILKECDILIGVFWTRIGTPTGKSESGTVEEIMNHIKANKPAMIYFSSKDISPIEINQDQYKSLLEFQGKCKKLGLIEQFKNTNEFKDKVFHQLHMLIQKNNYIKELLKKQSGGDKNIILNIVGNNDKEKLSNDAEVLLKSASQDEHGTIFKSKTLGGYSIEAGDKSFGGESAREYAKWEHALNELIQRGFVVDRSYKDEFFTLTAEGWQVADTLPDNIGDSEVG